MSEIRSRPRTSRIAIDSTADTIVAGIALAGSILRGVTAATRAYRRGLASTTIPPLTPGVRIGASRDSIAPPLATPLDTIKVQAVATLMHCLVADPNTLSAQANALAAATTVSQARAASSILLAAARTEHHRAFATRLTSACVRASSAAGFTTAQVLSDPTGTVRIVACDKGGRALVTELDLPVDQEPQMATEVVGVVDGSCQAIQDQFDAALAAEGVRTTTPHRKFTGGVCELAAARAFILERLMPPRLADRALLPERTASPPQKRRAGRANTRPAQGGN